MIVIDLNECDISFHGYSSWCKENNIHIHRITFTKYRLNKEDFLFFKLKFKRTAVKQSRNNDYD